MHHRFEIARVAAMIRARAICYATLLMVVGCKTAPKQEESPPAPAATGHSTTTINPNKVTAPPPTPAPSDAAAAIDAGARIGGNGSPAYRDSSGQVHGPGGPVFMGHGPPCDVAHDHCLRPDVWFSVGNIVPGKLFRALPVFEFENIWYDWRGREVSPVKLYRTKAAGNSQIPAGTEVIVFSSETASKDEWVDSEHEALTSSRWVAGVTENASTGNMVRIKGQFDAPIETVRLIVGTKSP